MSKSPDTLWIKSSKEALAAMEAEYDRMGVKIRAYRAHLDRAETHYGREHAALQRAALDLKHALTVWRRNP
jgi:hypothetical protein